MTSSTSTTVLTAEDRLDMGAVLACFAAGIDENDPSILGPVFTTDATTTPTTESVKNHGQYVKALGSGKVAAQACAGMPVNSTQGVK